MEAEESLAAFSLVCFAVKHRLNLKTALMKFLNFELVADISEEDYLELNNLLHKFDNKQRNRIYSETVDKLLTFFL